MGSGSGAVGIERDHLGQSLCDSVSAPAVLSMSARLGVASLCLCLSVSLFLHVRVLGLISSLSLSLSLSLCVCVV
jgi:hypothetical protein